MGHMEKSLKENIQEIVRNNACIKVSRNVFNNVYDNVWTNVRSKSFTMNQLRRAYAKIS